MIAFEYQILIALCLDLVAGDPRWLPHPVRLIGRLASGLEAPMRASFPDAKRAGAATAVLVIAITSGAVLLVIGLSRAVNPLLGDVVSIYLIYAGIAARDMVSHSTAVYEALRSGSLEEARCRVGMICGRDTANLDAAGVTKAAVESVAENLVDGVTAPLLYAVIGGPVGIMIYKAVNTLDSTFGYKNERYLEFGRLSARIDDAANFVPARLTALLVPVAARLLGEKSSGACRVFLRDRRKHPSPNAGQTEAAVAGALGVQLGGLSFYGGHPSNKPTLGDPVEAIEPAHILRANALLVVTTVLFLGLMLGGRAIIVS
ncbi:MAG: adenosylcobinamide-phosphate synthase CbiB [Desulfomonile sp.]|nr:adenosylcobinamide-phosphate synthase CbiB [Desulfomonile sp.]